MLKPKAGDLNGLLLKDYLDARAVASMASAKAQIAEANVSKVRAKIEALGKTISYDWKNGTETVSVVDIAIGPGHGLT